MTIDEAIETYKKIANTDSNCPRYCMNPCEDCVKECKQIAEWLEELKMYRESSYGKLYGMVYNKAIDDFMKKSEYLLCENLIYQEMEDIAGQLKAGVDNDD